MSMAYSAMTIPGLVFRRLAQRTMLTAKKATPGIPLGTLLISTAVASRMAMLSSLGGTRFLDHTFLSVGFGSPLRWDAYESTDDEKFVIENLGCDNCSIGDGTRVSLESVATGNFVSASSCGSDYLNANATGRGFCEQFELRIY